MQKKCTQGGKCVTNVCVLVGEIVVCVCMCEGGWGRNFKLQVCVIAFEYILISAFFHHSTKHHLTGCFETEQDNL